MSHIVIWRMLFRQTGPPTGYWHHGVLCDDGSVIHFRSRASPKAKCGARIARTSLRAFVGSKAAASPSCARDRVVYRIDHEQQLPSAVAAERAASALGRDGYRLLDNNCETFARWCVLGDRRAVRSRRRVSLPQGSGDGHAMGDGHENADCDRFRDQLRRHCSLLPAGASRQTAAMLSALVLGARLAGPVGALFGCAAERSLSKFRYLGDDYVQMDWATLVEGNAAGTSARAASAAQAEPVSGFMRYPHPLPQLGTGAETIDEEALSAAASSMHPS